MQTVQVLSQLDGTKFNAQSDLSALSAAIDLTFTLNQGLWKRGTPERELLLDLLNNKLVLDPEKAAQDTRLVPLVQFLQGILILSISLTHGLGRSPISVTNKDNTFLVRINSKAQTFKITPGTFDPETSKLVREWKATFYGQISNDTISNKDFGVIKAAFIETAARVKTEKNYIEKLALNPLLIFREMDNFSTGLFLVLSALPTDQMNALLIHIGSHLPTDLEEVNEDMFKVNVRNYLSSTTTDLHELFKKIRLVLKLYFSRTQNIISIIVKDKVTDFFKKMVESNATKAEIKRNLQETAQQQFQARMTVLEGLVKLL